MYGYASSHVKSFDDNRVHPGPSRPNRHTSNHCIVGTWHIGSTTFKIPALQETQNGDSIRTKLGAATQPEANRQSHMAEGNKWMSILARLLHSKSALELILALHFAEAQPSTGSPQVMLPLVSLKIRIRDSHIVSCLFDLEYHDSAVNLV